MGTRNLTMVVSNGQTKIAQYGQWDGYPSGNGVIVLDFVKTRNLELFKEKLEKCKFADEEKEKEVEAFLKSIGSENGWMTMEQSELYKNEYPYYSRDIGAGILDAVLESENEVIDLTDHTGFAADSLFCEWAYVIDLDKRVLEVYSGFNKNPIDETNRFATLPKDKNHDGTESEYYQIALVQTFSLDELPDRKEFLAILEPETEEEEDQM